MPVKKRQLYVTLGLSCYWQIALHRNDPSLEEEMGVGCEVCEGAQLLGGRAKHF